jgi:hypothetical protein
VRTLPENPDEAGISSGCGPASPELSAPLLSRCSRAEYRSSSIPGDSLVKIREDSRQNAVKRVTSFRRVTEERRPAVAEWLLE